LKVCENIVQRREIGLTMEKLIKGSKKLYNELLHNLYSSPNNIRVKGCEIGGTCSTHRKDGKYVQRFGLNSCRKEENFVEQVHGRKILKWILNERI
jgi:hypothetical protein